MPLFPQQFIDDLKHHADIVVVIQDYVSLKKTGATYKGLCPFHGEKTPSFHVNRDKGFFHCFGCGVGGDVFKFLELHEKVGFQDAVKQLAQRFGMTIPELEQNDEQRASTAEREGLLKVHEAAAAWFREQLASPAGARIRQQIAGRGISDATSEALGLGFAPPARDALKQALLKQGFSQALLLRAGLLVQRDDGSVIDRFRNRLMIPICRDTGFGHRVRRPGARRRPAAEVPELARDADLLEEPDALRPQPEQGGHPPGGVRGAGRGLFRLRPGLSGRGPGGGGVVRDGADARPSSAATPVHGQGRPELRPGRRRPGRDGKIVRNAGR